MQEIPAAAADLNNIQGDIWSKGFPKHNETYYLFKIETGRAADFARNLRKMVDEDQALKLISNLSMVKGDQERITKEKKEAAQEGREPKKLPMINALIAFTYKGLQIVSTMARRLDLEKVGITDPAFSIGMKADGPDLNDPTTTTEPDDPLANPDTIHGLLKVAGSSDDLVNERLKKIKDALQHGTVINDAGGTKGRIDGATRTDGNRGKEHFGFEDGISQPLMNGSMKSRRTRIRMPMRNWMYGGSFLVFRKLEQDVAAFNHIKEDFKTYGCASPAHMGAKLMGRWPSGAPVTLEQFRIADAPGKDHNIVKEMNNFGYEELDPPPAIRPCPLASHIRKTNPRRLHQWLKQSGDQGLKFSRIIRAGIPYGPDYAEDEPAGKKRGLLFACYQGSIEDGFRHMQITWCNDEAFPLSDTGPDPIIGRVKAKAKIKKGENVKGTLITEGFPPLPVNQPLVTFRGGEYFFVPSFEAMRGKLTAVDLINK
ncbi:Dyp-type peroxidase [Echria macrotheca]|uniref:Dyp-type peroxidase n=1 Tax=Echria macrotheca TaxID=438768 RepID=A0AAJ0B3P3_9PEZI|nr:Dyp-type peroxidase [Echria macrotheca]